MVIVCNCPLKFQIQQEKYRIVKEKAKQDTKKHLFQNPGYKNLWIGSEMEFSEKFSLEKKNFF